MSLIYKQKITGPAAWEGGEIAKDMSWLHELSEIEIAVKELDQAIQRDPEYAAAYAERGIATMLLSDQQYGAIPHDESNRRGKRFANQALQLDPNLAEGLAPLGLRPMARTQALCTRA